MITYIWKPMDKAYLVDFQRPLSHTDDENEKHSVVIVCGPSSCPDPVQLFPWLPLHYCKQQTMAAPSTMLDCVDPGHETHGPDLRGNPRPCWGDWFTLQMKFKSSQKFLIRLTSMQRVF